MEFNRILNMHMYILKCWCLLHKSVPTAWSLFWKNNENCILFFNSSTKIAIKMCCSYIGEHSLFLRNDFGVFINSFGNPIFFTSICMLCGIFYMYMRDDQNKSSIIRIGFRINITIATRTLLFCYLCCFIVKTTLRLHIIKPIKCQNTHTLSRLLSLIRIIALKFGILTAITFNYITREYSIKRTVLNPFTCSIEPIHKWVCVCVHVCICGWCCVHCARLPCANWGDDHHCHQ